MTSVRAFLIFLAINLFLSLSAHAQSTAEPAVALAGQDVVSYFKDGGPGKGQATFRHDFDGARYLFASAQNKATFVAEPDRYLPPFTGLCANGMSQGFKGTGDPNAWKIVNGKLQLFHSPAVREKAESDPTTIAQAHQNWEVTIPRQSRGLSKCEPLEAAERGR